MVEKWVVLLVRIGHNPRLKMKPKTQVNPRVDTYEKNLYWMRSLGFTISEIVQAGGTTLAANYQTLTGKSTAYQDLLAAVRGLKVTSDNPFQTGLYQMHGDGTIWIYTGPPLTGRL